MAAERLMSLLRETLRLDEGIGELSLSTFVKAAEGYAARYLNLPDLSGFKDEDGDFTDDLLMSAVVFLAAHYYRTAGQPQPASERENTFGVERILNQIKDVLP